MANADPMLVSFAPRHTSSRVRFPRASVCTCALRVLTTTTNPRDALYVLDDATDFLGEVPPSVIMRGPDIIVNQEDLQVVEAQTLVGVLVQEASSYARDLIGERAEIMDERGQRPKASSATPAITRQDIHRIHTNASRLDSASFDTFMVRGSCV